jgi:hypothetical protein
VVVAIALVGLGIQGNWPKFARVLSSAVTYVVVLPIALRGPPQPASKPRRPFWPFGLAGAAAGLVSGLARGAARSQPPRSAALPQRRRSGWHGCCAERPHRCE